MKILWFANTPCGSAKYLNSDLVIGGWLSALESELSKFTEIELYVCFYWKNNLKPFEYNNVNYYPIYRSKLSRFVKRFHGGFNEKNEVEKLINAVTRIDPDVIHIHGTEYNFGLIQLYTKIPVVISLQGILTPYAEKFFSGIPKYTAIFYEGLVNKLLSKSANKQYSNLIQSAKREQKILRQAKYIIGRTDWDKRINSVLSKDSLYFIGNELLRPQFYNSRWNKECFSDSVRLVTIMSGGLYKGLETIAKTAQILQNQCRIKYEWTIIGQDENSELAMIVKKWLKVEFKSLNVNLIGNKVESEVIDVLLRSDIYCQVSHIENSPNSVCEAMILGMPIIASFAGGTDTILENKKEGFLVQSGDPYSLAGAIIEMMNNFEVAKAMGDAAHAKAVIRHSKQEVVSNLIKTYTTIISSN